MANKKLVDELSVAELEQLLQQKKQGERQARLERLQENGRLVQIPGIELPAPAPPPLPSVTAQPTGALSRYALDGGGETALSTSSRP